MLFFAVKTCYCVGVVSAIMAEYAATTTHRLSLVCLMITAMAVILAVKSTKEV